MKQPDVAFPLELPEVENGPSRTASLSLMHSLLHNEIDSFCKQVGKWTRSFFLSIAELVFWSFLMISLPAKYEKFGWMVL